MSVTRLVSFGDWTLHRASGELERDGKRVRLQDIPFQILDELLSHPGDVVTREQLIARLWPKTVVDYDTNLNSSIRRLRAVLQDDASAPRYIETVPRRGYRYVGAPPRLHGVDAHEEGRPGDPAPRLIPLRFIVTLLVVAMAGITYWASRGPVPPSSGEAVASATTQLRLAVLPFENMSADPADAVFTDAMHEEVLSNIARRAPGLEVISRTTMMGFRTARTSVRDVARDLKATHVLEGSVRRDTSRVRLSVTLIDAQRDVLVWSSDFDRPIGQTIALQAEVAGEVGSQLAVKLSGNIGQLPQSLNPAAYDLYVEARSLLLRTVDANRSALEQANAEALLDRAIATDGHFAAAYLERARLRLARFVSSQDTSEANVHALQADLAAARTMMGDSPPLLITEAQSAQLVELDAERASRLLRTAQAMNPHSSELHQALARQLGAAGMSDESLAHFARAAELDPANSAIVADWAAALKMAGRAQDSLRIASEFDARYPGRISYGWRLFGFTGQLEQFERETNDATRSMDASVRIERSFDLLRYSGRLAELERLLEQSPVTMIRQITTGGFTVPAAGRKPVAELRGWLQLLRNDAPAAAREGRAILEFVAREPQTKWNRWYLRMLRAEGVLFAGDRDKAIVETRSALESVPRNVHPGLQRYSRVLGARIFAWAGARDEAVRMLEELSTSFPMIGPAEIICDPLYTVPLAKHVRFEALVTKLESRVAAYRMLQEARADR